MEYQYSDDDTNVSAPGGILALGAMLDSLVQGKSCQDSVAAWKCEDFEQDEFYMYTEDPSLRLLERHNQMSWDDGTIATAADSVFDSLTSNGPSKVFLTGDKALLQSDPHLSLLRSSSESIVGETLSESSNRRIIKAPSQKDLNNPTDRSAAHENITVLKEPQDAASSSLSSLKDRSGATASSSSYASSEGIELQHSSLEQLNVPRTSNAMIWVPEAESTSGFSSNQNPHSVIQRPPQVSAKKVATDTSSSTTATTSTTTSTTTHPTEIPLELRKHYPATRSFIRVRLIKEIDLNLVDEEECVELGEDGDIIPHYEERGFEYQERIESRLYA
jgi:hypothetical protein